MIQGSCHCGAIQWRFEGMPESATACNCTVCRRYGVLWIYDFEGEGINVSGPRRIAVNLRLTEPEAVAHIPIDHFEGLNSFEDLPRDGRCVADYWF
jgi:hypothetical protein